MSLKREQVFEFIDAERHYQGQQCVEGRFEKMTHTPGEEILLMQAYLDKAAKAFTSEYGNLPAIKEIVKVVALGVRCLENHGFAEMGRK